MRLRFRVLQAHFLAGLTVAWLAFLAADTAQAVWPFDAMFPKEPGPVSDRAAALLAEAIRISTVNPPGNEEALARNLFERLRAAGIETRVVDTPSPEGGPKRAALWARLRGGDRPGLVLLSHLDTVPAEPSEWSVDPFDGRIWDGFVWGRGALDAKGVVITHVMTLLELARRDVPLERDIVLLATPEEETGGRLGAGWLVENRPDLFEGAGYLLTEGGGIQPTGGVGPAPKGPEIWGVTLVEKSPCWLELEARGRGGHSSAPTPEAAVPRLIAALDRIRRAEAPLRVTPEVSQMFATLAPLAADWDREGWSDLELHLARDASFRDRFLGNPGQNALVRNTVSITVLEGAPKTNVAPPRARAHLDARLLPGATCDEFREALVELVDDDAVEIRELLSFDSVASTIDSPLFRAIERLAADQTRPAVVVPRMIGGFTDAHWFREAGLVAYGFVPRRLPAEEARRVHGVDERMSVEDLAQSIGLMMEIIHELDVADRAEAEAEASP